MKIMQKISDLFIQKCLTCAYYHLLFGYLGVVHGPDKGDDDETEVVPSRVLVPGYNN